VREGSAIDVSTVGGIYVCHGPSSRPCARALTGSRPRWRSEWHLWARPEQSGIGLNIERGNFQGNWNYVI